MSGLEDVARLLEKEVHYLRRENAELRECLQRIRTYSKRPPTQSEEGKQTLLDWICEEAEAALSPKQEEEEK